MTKPRGVLIERRGSWLFHTTTDYNAERILTKRELSAGEGGYVSVSDTLNWADGIVTFVLSRARMKYSFTRVRYTKRWASRNPDKAAYVAWGSGTYDDEADDAETLKVFLGHASEREWVSHRSDIPLKPGDIDRILVKPTSGGRAAKVYERLKILTATSSLIDVDDVKWRAL